MTQQAPNETPPQIPVGPPPRDVRDGPLPLLLFAALLVYLGVKFGRWAPIAIVAIMLMILLHELGHFIAAKRGGMKVTEFFLGFGPRLWSFTRGETTYGLKAIPLGAYVRVIGMSNLEEVPPEDEARTYRQATYPRRMAVAVAGSTMHFIQAIVLLVIVYVGFGVPTESWKIREVTEDSPASAAGLVAGDRLISIGGQPVGEFGDVSGFLSDAGGLDTEIVFERDGAEQSTTVLIAERFESGIEQAIPGLETGDRLLRVDDTDATTYRELTALVAVGESHRFDVARRASLCSVTATVVALPSAGPSSQGFLGVSAKYDMSTENIVVATGRSFGDFGRVAKASVSGMARFFQPRNVGSFVSDSVDAGVNGVDDSVCRSLTDDENRVLSIFGFFQIAKDAGEKGVGNFIELFALFNIFIGLFNLIPLLPFDGGHVVVATYERVRSRNGKRHFANMNRLMPLVYVVAAAMVFLGVLALTRDIIDPLSLGG